MATLFTVSTSVAKEPAYHHGELRAALIAATLDMLAEDIAPSALSLREAARRAGVSAMAPYRHFADKDELLAAAAAVGFDRLAAALREADQAPHPREALLAQGVAYVAFATANRSLFGLMFGSVLGKRHDALVAAGEAAFAVMAERIAQLAGLEKAKLHAIRCWALAHGLASLALDGKLADIGMAPAALADAVLRLDDGDLARGHDRRTV